MYSGYSVHGAGVITAVHDSGRDSGGGGGDSNRYTVSIRKRE